MTATMMHPPGIAESSELALACTWDEDGTIHFASTAEACVHIIYSADILGTEGEIDSMGPAERGFAEQFVETEGDEQYDYGYLGDECNDPYYYPAGYTDKEGLVEATDDTDYELVGLGRHRKWCGELTWEEWLRFADAYYIDLDDEGHPDMYTDTMGALTMDGLLPAVAVDNTDGWNPTNVIDSSFYITILRFRGLD